MTKAHADFVGYPHHRASPQVRKRTLPANAGASPKGSLYISRAFSILNVILLSSKLRTNKIGVDIEAITTKASLGGSWQRS